MRRTTAALGLALLAALAGRAADEPVTIKEYKDRPGDRFRVVEEEKTTTKTVVTVGGKRMENTEEEAKAVAFVEEIVERPAGEKRPTKVKRTYEKYEVTKGGKAEKAAVGGKTVLIEKKGDKYAFSYAGGGAVEGPLAADLGKQFNKPADAPVGAEGLLPDKPVKPGDTWQVDKDVLARAFGGGDETKIDKAKTTAVGKLVKAYTKDGKQFGVLEYKIDLPVVGLGGKSPLTVKEGTRITAAVTMDVCIDGTDGTERETGRIGFRIVGTAMGADVNVDSDSTHTKTREPLPKK